MSPEVVIQQNQSNLRGISPSGTAGQAHRNQNSQSVGRATKGTSDAHRQQKHAFQTINQSGSDQRWGVPVQNAYAINNYTTLDQQSTGQLIPQQSNNAGNQRKAISNPRSFMRHRMAQQKQDQMSTADLPNQQQTATKGSSSRPKSRHGAGGLVGSNQI